MHLGTLQRRTPNASKKRVGRGGKRGKTSGKGHKGQKARAGGTPRPALRDIIKKLPKRRGYGKNRARTVNSGVVKPSVVNIAALETTFNDGERVTPKLLVAKKLVAPRRGKAPKVKVLGHGELKKKLTVVNCDVSVSARKHIETAGGSVE